jgi:hypothetical protein
MPKAARLPDPESLFWEFTGREEALRRGYLEVGAPSPPRATETPPEQLVKNSAVLLELLAVADCLFEIVAEPAPQPASAMQLSAISERVRQLCGLDLQAVVSESQKRLAALAQPDLRIEISMQLLVRVTKSAIEACPIDRLERIAVDHGLEVWGNRCRVAHTALKGFVFRNDEQQPPRIRLLGRQYVRGELSAQEVSTILGVPVFDVLVLLESYGFNRPLETLALAAEQRATFFERIRADRLHRKGQPVTDPELAARDVIASERLEGVDARQWTQRPSH